ncbi:MAG TPA: pitrilysin family protein [Vicinamibacterales bacterium]|nr:pitrilysin family protein [Vicinamibacterales bacterium]
MRVPFAKRTLGNGLDVIVHESREAPLAAVSVWYHVGSKNERPGRTGLAHLFEHLMFEGSAHQPHGYFEPLQEAGAALNGSTSTDRTNYWEVVPTDALRLALWMEADRMGWLLPALSEERFQNQREVVLNERRQSYENRPYGLAQFALLEGLYPPDHPYHWPTIGHPEDLRAAGVDDARAFFGRFYHPGNASLAIAGDVDTESVFAVVEELFGEIAAGADVEPPAPAAVAATRRDFILEDRVELPRLYLAWPSPPLFADGDAELDLTADILGNGRTSRLYRRLIHDTRLATELAAAQTSRELAGTFQVLATAAPGHTLGELAAAIIEEVERFLESGPTDAEMARGRAQAESAFVFRTQTLGGFGGKADQLNAYNVYRGTPDYFDADLGRYLHAAPAMLRDAAREWLVPEAMLTLSVVPSGRRDLALAPDAPVWVARS